MDADRLISNVPPIRYTLSRLADNVFFDDESIFENVKAKGCNWTDVVFVNCKMADVTFSNVNLHGVRFYNVDFRRMHITDVSLRATTWQDIEIKDWVVSPDVLGTQPSENLPRLHCNTSSHSKTKATVLQTDSAACNKRDRKALDGRVLRNVELELSKPTNLLDLPQPVLEGIVSAMYHQNSVFLHECAYVRPAHLKEEDPPDRTIYWTSNPVVRSTYKAYPSGLGACIKFLRVNKVCFGLAVNRVYDRIFGFSESAESCLAFLHDHRRKPYRISKLSLWYAPKLTTSGPKTNAASWRRLFNVLVHERADLKNLDLGVREEFWKVAPWEEGVDAVLAWEWPLAHSHHDDENERKPRPNFLQHVSRLSGVKFFLQCTLSEKPYIYEEESDVDDEESHVDEIAFGEALQRRIEEEMNKRPRLVETRYGPCGTRCYQKRLEDCCYYKRR
ncbi:hypothetical protein LTR08_004964 [Meristemomyces frigidus]|nr:hypothetical protein LTR08_004964 [Meristemomyces frigidus]